MGYLSKIRSTLYNAQRQLGTVQMVSELVQGDKKGLKKLANKFIGRNIISKLWRK